MREIKFRSIIPSVENPKEFYTVYYSLCSEIKDVPEHIKYMLKKWLSEGNNPDQYIGLKDKNGKEIYEMDVLGDFIGCGVVKYNECTASFVIDIQGEIDEVTFHEINYENYVLEVIGNVWQNPELLDIENV